MPPSFQFSGIKCMTTLACLFSDLRASCSQFSKFSKLWPGAQSSRPPVFVRLLNSFYIFK